MGFEKSAESVFILLMLALPGFILVKTKLLNEQGTKTLANILILVCQPFIYLNAFTTNTYSNDLLADIGWITLFAFASQLVMLGLSKLIYLPDKDKLRANTYVYASSLGNVGFMGIPVVQTLLPGNTTALMFVAIFMATFNIICWTLGVYILTGDKKYISFKRAFLNPSMLGMMIALPLFFLNVEMPKILAEPIGMLASLNTPIAMIILGAKFGLVRFRELFKGYGVYLSSIIKLIITPLLMYCVLIPLELSDNVETVLLILTCMPSANMVLIMAEKFDGDTVSATKSVMLSTLFSIVTIPLILLLV